MGLVFVQNSPFSVLHQKLACSFGSCVWLQNSSFFFCFLFSVLHQKLGLLGSYFAAKFKLLFCFSKFLCTTRSRRRKKRRKRK